MSSYSVQQTDSLRLECTSPLSGMYKLSPFVWYENQVYNMLLRAVNPSEDPTQKVARIYYGTSEDGLTFHMNDIPVIVPGTTALDKDGCEDPTLIIHRSEYLIYYSGWNQTTQQGQLLLSRGSTMDSLRLTGIAIPGSADYLNPKEASLLQYGKGEWNLYFEYSNEDRSKFGIANSATPIGPWKIKGEFLPAQPDSWDSYHLSPGPIVQMEESRNLMFYNGSGPDAHWRIGWIELNQNGIVIARSLSPLVSPPKSKPGETDIAFVASALIVQQEIWIYYTTADSKTYRAIIQVC